MANLPAQCTKCGHVFSFEGINIPGITNVVIENSKTYCPICGSEAKIFDGQFLVSNNVAEFISGPKATKEALEKLNGIVVALLENKITPKTAINQAKKINSDYGKLLGTICAVGVGAVTVFAAILSIYIDIKSISNEAADEDATLSYRESKLAEGRKQTKLLERILSEKFDKLVEKKVDETGDLKLLEIPIPKSKPRKPNQGFYRTRSEIIFWNPSECRVRIYPGGIE